MIFLPTLVLLAAAGQQARTVAARAEVTQQAEPGVRRPAMQVEEKTFDGRLENSIAPDPFDLLGNTRGVYLPGYGVVLTAEIDLIKVPGISPFHPAITPEERPKLHARKLAALSRLRDVMRTTMVSAAGNLHSLPLNENIVVGVTLFYFVGEDTSGLPMQVVMQATRQQLLTNPSVSSIKVQEF